MDTRAAGMPQLLVESRGRDLRETAMPVKPPDAGEPTPAKKPYETPRLEVYGDIREIVKTSGTMGMFDNALRVARTR
jgi:hypothetical protein